MHNQVDRLDELKQLQLIQHRLQATHRRLHKACDNVYANARANNRYY